MPSDFNSVDLDDDADFAADERPAIVFHDVTKAFQINHTKSFKETFIAALKRKKLSDTFNAVDHLSLQVPQGQSIALMGHNGSGKSTTLKLLSGVLRPDTGWVRTRGRVAGLLEVGAGFHPDLTGRDNIYLNAAILGMSKEETEEQFENILEFSEIGKFIDTEVKRLSSGMKSRLGFAVAVHTKVDVLLVDEVLSVGDAAFRRKCDRKMRELRAQGKTMFIVSHNANQVRKLCDRGVVLDHGQMVFDGPIDEAVMFLNTTSSGGEGSEQESFAIETPFSNLYLRDPSKFGQPLGPQIEVSENGGGVYQEFEQCVVTSFTPEGAEKPTTRRLGKGTFRAAYMALGGPAGPWGFIVAGPRGNLDAYEERTMQFQNGLAKYTIDDGISFIEGAVREEP